MKTLVVVACGSKKIWDTESNAGPTVAKDAYTSTMFKFSRKYAEHFGDSWLILSAKHGFVEPEFMIPGNYNVTFNTKSTNPVQINTLREQVKDTPLHRFDRVVVLGGARYVGIVEAAFFGSSASVIAPLKGLGIGLMQSKLKKSIEAGRPL